MAEFFEKTNKNKQTNKKTLILALYAEMEIFP